jgi:hypothetical protein
VNQWAALKRLSFVVDDEDFADLVSRSGLPVRSPVTPDSFREDYSHHVCDASGWPRDFETLDETHVAEGIPVFSLSGRIEGRTTGSRTKCRSKGCPGWFVGILWETGQQMYLCSEGWHFDRSRVRIDIIGGGEISARYVSPAPLGVHPAPRAEWPKKADLNLRRGWRVHPR